MKYNKNLLIVIISFVLVFTLQSFLPFLPNKVSADSKNPTLVDIAENWALLSPWGSNANCPFFNNVAVTGSPSMTSGDLSPFYSTDNGAGDPLGLRGGDGIHTSVGSTGNPAPSVPGGYACKDAFNLGVSNLNWTGGTDIIDFFTKGGSQDPKVSTPGHMGGYKLQNGVLTTNLSMNQLFVRLVNALPNNLFISGERSAIEAKNPVAPKSIQYQLFYDSFTKDNGCQAKPIGPISTLNDTQKAESQGQDGYWSIYYVDSSGNKVPTLFHSSGFGGGDSIAVSWGLPVTTGGSATCAEIAQHLGAAINGNSTYSVNPAAGASSLADAYAAIVKNDPALQNVLNTQQVTSANSGSPSASNCSKDGGSFSWILCGVINIISEVEQSLINIVNTLLQTKPIDFSVPTQCAKADYANANPTVCTKTTNTQYSNGVISATIYSVWSQFRLYGNILLVIGLIVVVFAEAIGGGATEAYSVRKMLPKILAAAILINLSIYIIAALEDITNIIGSGIQSVMVAPFAALNLNSVHVTNGVSTALVSIGSAGIVLSPLLVFSLIISEGLAGIFLLILFGVLLAVLGVLITLTIRQALLVFLIITSPIAFSLYFLPNTSQYFKKWWDLLIKTLMVYPVVSVILTMSYIASIVFTQFGFGPLAQIMGIVAALAPLFLIPFALKLSGGVIGQASTALQGLQKRANKPVKEWRRKNRAARREKAEAEKLWSPKYKRLNKLASDVAITRSGKAGLNPLKLQDRLKSVRRGITKHDVDEAMKDQEFAALAGNGRWAKVAANYDTEDEMVAAWREMGEYKDDNERRSYARSAMAFKRRHGVEAANRALAVAAGTDKTAQKDAHDYIETLYNTSHGDEVAAADGIVRLLGATQSAGRLDMSGGGYNSFSEGLKLYAERKKAFESEEKNKGKKYSLKDDKKTAKDIDNLMYKKSYDALGPSAAVYGHTSSVEHLAQVQFDHLQELADSVKNQTPMKIGNEKDPRIPTADDITTQFSAIAGTYDAMASASPNNADAYAKFLFSQSLDIDGLPPEIKAKLLPPDQQDSNSVSILGATEELRNDPVLLEHRRELGKQYYEEAQARAPGQNPGGGLGTPPGGQPAGPKI